MAFIGTGLTTTLRTESLRDIVFFLSCVESVVVFCEESFFCAMSILCTIESLAAFFNESLGAATIAFLSVESDTTLGAGVTSCA